MAMTDEALLKKLSAETRTKLRSTQILTSLPTIISELLQNAIDAGASQIDVGVDCSEWSCWAMDNGSGFTKDGLRKVGQGSEHGRYISSKAYTPASLETVSTFGFRGEALASMADLSCLEISSRTARSRESWSVIVKAGKSLYIGPSIRWQRESPGTVVSIRDAFFNLPVRRQSHPTPHKTIELIRQELEVYTLVFPNISLSLQDASKIKDGHHPRKSHILKTPKTRSTLAAFRHLYGRAFTEETCVSQCVEEIAVTSGQLRIEGFISLVGAHAKSYQFLYINRHLISPCDIHRLIDNRFAASTFAKHAYDEGGETSLRSSVRRSPRKGEKKPVYVLNLIIPVKHIDNCLEPSKSMVELDNKSVVASFLSETIQSFLVHHNFAPEKTRNEDPGDPSPRKRRKLAPEGSANPKTRSDLILSESSETPNPSVRMVRASAAHVYHSQSIWELDKEKMPVSDAQKTTGETFIIDNRTGNSYPQNAHFTMGADGADGANLKRRTLQLPQLITAETHHNKNSTYGDHTPNWLRDALEANDAFALREPKIPFLPLLVNQAADCRSSQFHECHADCSSKRVNQCFQPGPCSFTASRIRFRKDDLRKAQIISQVDCKFIACVVGLDPLATASDDETREDEHPAGGKTLILIDQHAADEREGSGAVETKQLSPPVPVLLTKHEASRLVEYLDFQKAFESWGFRFSGLEETRSRLDCETGLDGGYIQVLVCTVPEIVSEKLLSGNELQELVKGYIGALESRELEPRDPLPQHDSGNLDGETQWLKALRWCPRELLDLINSKACRGAIMFNDPLNTEQCERLVKQLSTTVFPFQCAHGRPSLVPLTRLSSKIGGPKATELDWEKIASL